MHRFTQPITIIIACIMIHIGYATSSIATLFSGDYASAYDGSDLVINGPQTNLDLYLLQLKPSDNTSNYLRLSGNVNTAWQHTFAHSEPSSVTINNLE